MAGLHPTRIVTVSPGPVNPEAAVGCTEREPGWTFEAVVDRFESPLLRYAAGLLDGDATGDAAQDVVQDAMLRLHTQWIRHGQSSVEHVPTWLYRVTRNLAMDALRKRAAGRRFTLRWKTRLRHDEPTRMPDAPHVVDAEQAETLTATRRVLDDMPARPRELLMLKAHHNLTVRQIAQVLAMPHSTVAHQLNKALADLAQRLKEQGVI